MYSKHKVFAPIMSIHTTHRGVSLKKTYHGRNIDAGVDRKVRTPAAEFRREFRIRRNDDVLGRDKIDFASPATVNFHETSKKFVVPMLGGWLFTMKKVRYLELITSPVGSSKLSALDKISVDLFAPCPKFCVGPTI